MSYEKAPYQDSEKSFQNSEKSFLPPPPPYTTAAYPQPTGPVAPPQHAAPNQAYYHPGAPFTPSTGYGAPPPQAQNQQPYYYPGAPVTPSTSPYPTGGAPPVAAPAPPPSQAYPPSSSSSSSLHAFPPTINGYYSWKSMTTIYLGPSKSEKTHALKIHDKLFSSKQTLALHAGPTPDHPVLVSAFSRGYKDQEFTVTVPGRGPGGADVVVPTSSIKTGKMSRAARFEVEVGPGGRREMFEWRSSHGEEISAVATGYSFGWKLVRLSGGGAAANGGGPVGAGLGFSSDGNEVVAVIAHNASCSMSKGMRFSFLGSGLAGAFGELWEIVAVGSALKLWYRDVEHMASAASG